VQEIERLIQKLEIDKEILTDQDGDGEDANRGGLGKCKVVASKPAFRADPAY
jgi:hypothetical protein